LFSTLLSLAIIVGELGILYKKAGSEEDEETKGVFHQND